jgi:hypothetical protein
MIFHREIIVCGDDALAKTAAHDTKAMSGVAGVARLEAAVDVVATFVEEQPPGRGLAALRPRGRLRHGGESPRPCRRDRQFDHGTGRLTFGALHLMSRSRQGFIKNP